jgi:hypothetical protein
MRALRHDSYLTACIAGGGRFGSVLALVTASGGREIAGGPQESRTPDLRRAEAPNMVLGEHD